MNNFTREDIDIMKMIMADHIKSLELRLESKSYVNANDRVYRDDILNEIVLTRNAYEKLKSL